MKLHQSVFLLFLSTQTVLVDEDSAEDGTGGWRRCWWMKMVLVGEDGSGG